MKKTLLPKLLTLAMILAIALTALIACDAESVKVSFMVDDEVYKVVDLESGDAVKLPEEPKKDGYVFEGWYLDKGIWEKQFLGRIEDSTVMEIVVYAKWSQNAPIEECKHHEVNKIEISVEDCEHNYIDTCAECGAVIDSYTETIHTWSENSAHFMRESCLVGAHTATYCVECGAKNADTIVYKSADEDGKCYSEHKDVIETTYPIDSKTGEAASCVCTTKTIKTKICRYCNVTIESSELTQAPGHEYGDWAFTVIPTADSKGEVRRTCSVCGDNEEKEIPIPYCFDYDEMEIDSYYTHADSRGCSCSDDGRVDKFSCNLDGQTLSFEIKVVDKNHYIIADGKKIYVKLDEVNDYVHGFYTINGARVSCYEKGTDAIFTCAECYRSYSVKVRKPHTAYNSITDSNITNIVEATCTMAGMCTYVCYECCQMVEAEVPALGHAFVLDGSKGGMSITEGVDGKKEFTLYLKCVNGCSYSGSVVADSFDEIEIPATCTASAMIEYTNIKLKDGTVLTNSDGAPLRIMRPKGAPLGHADGVVVYGEYNIADLSAENVTLINGLDFSCKDYDGSNDDAWKDAVYLCPDCYTYIAIKVCKSHTAKDGTPAYYEVEPSCTESGLVNYKCSTCSIEVNDVVLPALGHQLDWKILSVSKTRVIIDVVCLHEGCKMHRDFKTSASSYSDFSSEDGIVVVDLAKGAAQGWDVQTIISGNCSIGGIYRFTFAKEFEESGVKFVFDTPMTFDIEIKTAHDLIDDISCSCNGTSYNGKYCKECEKIVKID